MPISTLRRLLSQATGEAEASRLLALVEIDVGVERQSGDMVSRAVLAQAMNLILLRDLLHRVPTGAAYVADVEAAGGRIVFDHGAVRTVGLDGMGELPSGEETLLRVLRPLGYYRNETYPLGRLGMTGRAYTHLDFPESVPQFFVSELHVDRFSPVFRAAALRVTQASVDPLGPADKDLLAALEAAGGLPFEAALALLPRLVACFGRQHPDPSLADYDILLAESAEMAWIATEGNAFNHATDRVGAIDAVVSRQRELGRPLKPVVEVSTNGRIQQTAFLADEARRRFVLEDGSTAERAAPGSFFEFIQREIVPETSRLDLSFDSSNAQGIFKMTSASAA